MTDPIGSVSGLASGIQWRDLITQVVNAESARRVTPLAQRVEALGKRRDAWNTFSGLLTKLGDAARGLADGSAVGLLRATATNSPSTARALVSATAGAGAAPGTYGVEVRALATQEKLRGNAVTDPAAALGLAGTFTVNGASVTVAAGDSLTAVRDRINAVNTGTTPSGVTASIVQVSATEQYLTLTADRTGTNGVRLVDGGGVLRGLGVSTDSLTRTFTSDVTPIAQMLGLPSPPAVRTILIDGKEVTVDLRTDTLRSLMNKVAAAGGTASVVTSTDATGALRYQLDVRGDVWGKADDADTKAVLDALAFTRANRLTEGADARLRLDGFDIVRSSNAITDAVAGVTLNLQAAEPGTTVQLSVSRDADAVVKKVEEFVAAFNSVLAFQKQQLSPNQPLHADATLRSTVAELRNALVETVPGLDPASTTLSRAGALGLTLDRDGTLRFDADTFRSALTRDYVGVRNFFGTQGSATGPGFGFVAAGTNARTGTYTVDVTRAATAASQTFAFTGPYSDTGTNANTLTVLDRYTGRTGSITLVNGDTAGTVSTKLASLFTAQGMTLSSGATATGLTISSSRYGSAAGFELSYSRVGPTGATVSTGLASPIGAPAGTYAGLDVQGRIYAAGETPQSVTGVGQLLTAPPGSQAAGIAVSYTGSAPASGSVRFVAGLGALLRSSTERETRSGDGSIATRVSGIGEAIDRLQRRQDDARSRIDRYRESLVQRFSVMEKALSQLQAQGSFLSSRLRAQ